MCGIAGLHQERSEADAEPSQAAVVGRMGDVLRHRGPDGDGLRVHRGRSVVGHRRLAIVDLDGGSQPIVTSDERRVMVGNGEIYNAPSLRPELARRHRFATGSDNEVALHLLGEHDDPVEAARRLDGMYALAVSDGDELLLIRDRLGIKPLYRGELDGAVVFASEVKAFPKGTSEVTAVEPGSIWSSRRGTTRYYDVPDVPDVDVEPGTMSVHARRVRAALERAVTKRMMADVPVGAFLSGGLDSSAVCALMRPMVDELHTFSVGMEGSDDLAAARRVAEHLGTTHHEYLIDEAAVREALPEVIFALESFDADLVQSAVPCWFTSRLAADHVKVVLTGEGADEIFAGYRYVGGIAEADVMQRELRRSVTTMHDVNLQRVDRMTMAHALEARVPFLDPELIDVGLSIPPEAKRPDGGPEKAVLREAVADLLPHDIVWRTKAQFDEGTGMVDMLARVVAEETGRLDADAYRALHPRVPLRTAAECRYHQIMVDTAGEESAGHMVATAGRWAFDRLS